MLDVALEALEIEPRKGHFLRLFADKQMANGRFRWVIYLYELPAFREPGDSTPMHEYILSQATSDSLMSALETLSGSLTPVKKDVVVDKYADLKDIL